MAEGPREASRFEGIFQPRSPIEFVLGCLMSIIILGPLSDFVKESLPKRAAAVLSISLFVLFFAAWWLFDRLRARRRVKQLTFQPNREPPVAAKGLVLLISPYDPRDAALRDEGKLKTLIEELRGVAPDMLTEDNFTKINLPDSNLRPQIKAVEYHVRKGSLRDVWLITSQSYDSVKGSEDAALILERFLRFSYGESINIHREGLSAKEWDYRGLWEIGERIFRESGFKEGVLLVDITGGTKMMSVALAMACIPPGRRMQYVYSDRDSHGIPLSKGKIDPVMIDVDPILYGK